MTANITAKLLGDSSGFDSKEPNRDNFRPPYYAPKHMYDLKEKWCKTCERSHAQGQYQFLMVDRLLKEGLVSFTT